MISFKKKYPFILLIADEKTDIDEVRRALSGVGIYFHIADFTCAKDLLPSADMIVIFSPQYSSPAKALTDNISDGNINEKCLICG